MKKLLSLVVALALVLMAVSAFAADITVNETATIYQYKVYQIYTGTLSTGAKLSDVKYGANYGTLGNAVPEAELNGITEANVQTKAKEIFAALHGDPVTTITYDQTNGYKATGLANGYYLIVEEYASGTTTFPEGTELSRNIVKVADTITINPKRSTTTQDKDIIADTLGDKGADSFTDATNETEDNLSVGDVVKFQISTAISANAVEYDRYFFIVKDTMSPGLTYNTNSLVVKINNVEKTLNTDYNVRTSTDTDGNTILEVGLTDAKSHAGESVVVTYSATLNEHAVIGEVGNPNTSKVIFSNDPHHNYDGDKDSTNPGFPASGKTVPTGETLEDRTKTYSTGIEIQKVDQDGNVLTGAGFTITGNSQKIVLVSSETWTENNESGDYYGLKNGDKTKTAPQTVDKMEEAGSGATAGYVVAESGYTGTDAVTVGGTTYRPYKPTEDSSKTVYKLIRKNDDLYDGKKYSKTVTYSQEGSVDSVAVTATVGKDGIVRFNGLGAGTYTISESTTPAGYNTIADFNVVITFTPEPTSGANHFTATSTGRTVNYEDGVFKIVVENRSGSTLPSTGGIGTTIFYILGGLLVVGAAVVLVARRKASN